LKALRPSVAFLVVVAAMLFAAPAFAAGPANDNFANAIAVSGSSGSVSGNTTGATNEAAEPNGDSGVWYSWRPSVSGATIFDTCTAASFDTVVDVYTGTSLGSLTRVATGDDGCGFKQSVTPFRATAGTNYWVRVGGYGGAFGTFTLSWNVAVNDDFATATVLTGSSGTASGNTFGATDEAGEPATASGGLWYSWTAPGTGTVTFDTCSAAAFDTVLDAYTGASVSSLAQVAHNDDACGTVSSPGDHGRQSSITLPTVAGTTYSVRISGAPGTSPNSGTYTLKYSYSGPVTTPVTAMSLCLLTAQDVRGSARYQGLALTSAQQGQVDTIVNTGCQAIGKIVPKLSPVQKMIAVLAYKALVVSLTSGSWLTPSQQAQLFGLADQL
jgi:hypothetical protein